MATTVDFPWEMGRSQQVSEPPREVFDTALLVAAARSGNRAAFGQLYDRYARMVHGILLARVPAVEVDDLVHDVFLLVLRRLPSLREDAAFGGWLAMIARNRANDYHRRAAPWDRRASAPRLGSADADSAGGSSAEDLPGSGGPTPEALAALEALRSLPDSYRETLILRLVEGLTGPEIAARTGMTPGSVRVNLHRGMKQLRKKLVRMARP